jgi:CARDB
MRTAVEIGCRGASCLLLLLGTSLASPAGAADVTVASVVVEPANPAPSTLCRLKVALKNGGTQTASNFKFDVKVDGEDVAVYKPQTYAVNVDPGKTDEIALYNFYSPKTPKPFDVQVTLLAAQWVQVKKEGNTTTTTPAGPVAGLPTSGSVAVKAAAGK